MTKSVKIYVVLELPQHKMVHSKKEDMFSALKGRNIPAQGNALSKILQ